MVRHPEFPDLHRAMLYSEIRRGVQGSSSPWFLPPFMVVDKIPVESVAIFKPKMGSGKISPSQSSPRQQQPAPRGAPKGGDKKQLVTLHSTGLKSSQIADGYDSNLGGTSLALEIRTFLSQWIRAIVY
jgi:hypothetical protein